MVYLTGAIPVRIVTSGAGVALALAAAVRLGDVAVAGLLIFALNAPSVVAAPVIGALTDAVRSPKRFMLGSALVFAGATRYLLTHGPLTRVVAAGAVVQLGAGMMPVVAVLVAVERGLAESAGGLLLTAFSIGGVTGALLIAVPAVTRRVGALPPKRVMAVCFAATGVLTLVAAATPSFALAAIALGLSGLPDAAGVAAMLRLRQEESPADVRAQVFVVAAGARVATAAVGAAVAGLIAGLDASLLLALVALPWLAAFPILLAGRRTAPA